MNDRIKYITNKRELVGCIGKEIKTAVVKEDSGYLTFTFHDGSTLEIDAGIMDMRVLFLNKEQQ